MKHTCSECLECGEIVLRPVTKITIHIDGSFGKAIHKYLKGQVKRKHISPEKCLKIQRKDNPDT